LRRKASRVASRLIPPQSATSMPSVQVIVAQFQDSIRTLIEIREAYGEDDFPSDLVAALRHPRQPV
jgi:hypothetical protein